MATKAKYYRVRGQQNKEDKPETDIIMKFNDSYGRYVSRALNLFFGEDKSFVTIKAAEKVSDKALWVAEVVKRRVEGLHQINNITEREIVDIYEPKEEGLLRVEQKRYLTILEVTLVKNPTGEQKKHPGYQAPVKVENAEFLTKEKWEEQEKERGEKTEKRRNRQGNGERGEERRRGGRRR